MEHKEYLAEELRNFISNVAWTHKIQVCQYDIYVLDKKRVNRNKVILSSLTSVGIGSFLLELSPKLKLVSIVVTFSLSLLTTVLTKIYQENDYEKLSLQNKSASDQYFLLREKATELLYNLNSGKDISKIELDFLKLKEDRNSTNSELPYTSPEAVELAGVKLKDRNDNDYTIDQEYLIPKELRSQGKNQ